MYERFTDRARKVVQLASQEAQRLNHEYIGTEHILLGLVSEGSGVAANVLKNLDIDIRKVRVEVEKIVRAGPDLVAAGKLPQTPRAKKVIEYAIQEARDLDHNYVGTEHLLLGLLREMEGVGAQVLMNLGLRLSNVRVEVLNLIGQPPSSSLPGTPALPAVESFSADPLPPGSPTHAPDFPSELPLKIALALDWLTQLVDLFGEMKGDAVAREKFEQAADFRDQQKKLRKIKQWLERNKHQDPPDTNIIDLS